MLFQHVFWFFGHPEVYILILPAFGVVSEIIPTFSRKPLFGYESMVYATASIGFLSFIVVGAPHVHGGHAAGRPAVLHADHHADRRAHGGEGVQLDGDDVEGFDQLRAADAVRRRVPVLFTIGGFSGLMLAIVPADFQYHDTYFVVAHFPLRAGAGRHLLDHGGCVLLAAEVDRPLLQHGLAKAHFWLSVIFVNVLFFPQHFLGLAGMPRRIPDYSTQFSEWNMISSLGAFGFGLSQLLFPLAIWQCVRGGPEGYRPRVGRRSWPGMGTAIACALSQLGKPASPEVGERGTVGH